MNKLIVYGLHGPDGKIRYVGKSERGLKRPREHGKPGHLVRHAHLPIVRWIKKLRESGTDYAIQVLEECEARKPLIEAEKRWIAQLRGDLLNLTDGGEGFTGRHSDETKAKMSASAYRRVEEYNAKLPPAPVGDVRCSVCNELMKSGARCLNCKRNHYFERGGEITDYCKSCVVIKPLLSNGECRRCAASAGLRECSRCLCVLPQLLSFNKKQGQCVDCRRALRRARRAGRRRS